MIGKVVIMVCLREDIPLKLFEINEKPAENPCVELNLSNEK